MFSNYRSPDDDTFLNKIFSDIELKYYFSKEYPAPHLAVRFPAKEAVIKALYGIGAQDIIDYREILKNTPLGRSGTPEDIAKAILFLSSDLSNYINGQIIGVDGGEMM